MATEDPIVKEARRCANEDRQFENWKEKMQLLIERHDAALQLANGKIPERNKHWAGELFEITSRIRLHMEGRRK